jgi:hypothetical protein
MLILGIAAWQTRDPTVYAPGFTEARFRTIRVGMPKKEVIRILGDPVSIEPASGYIYWTYLTNGCGDKPLLPERPSVVQSDVTFHADLNGKIEAVYGDYVCLDLKKDGMVGHSLEEVRERFGEPKETLTVPNRDYYLYSKMQNFKGQYIRAIVIYDSGLVGSVDAGRIGYYIEVDGVQPSPSSWIEWLEWNL